MLRPRIIPCLLVHKGGLVKTVGFDQPKYEGDPLNAVRIFNEKEVDELILSYKGSLSGEHNDGLVRGPWLESMYGPEIAALFKEAKTIFDPDNIFNPHKKSDANWDYSFSHVRNSF